MVELASVSAADFDEEALGSDRPVMVEFWAEWCVPSRTLFPRVEALSERFAGRLKVLRANVDEEPALAERYAVVGLPTVVLLRAGREVKRRVGLLSREELFELAEAFLGV